MPVSESCDLVSRYWWRDTFVYDVQVVSACAFLRNVMRKTKYATADVPFFLWPRNNLRSGEVMAGVCWLELLKS